MKDDIVVAQAVQPVSFSDAEIASLRARAKPVVDCRALARWLVAERRPPDPERREAVARAYGIDIGRTLTDIEDRIVGCAAPNGDEPEVHALRHVPVGHWTDCDIYLLLCYGEGGATALWLAIDRLTREPLMEAAHFPGDLLAITARRIVEDAGMDASERGRLGAALVDVLANAETRIWTDFHARCDALELDGIAVAAARRRLTRGGTAGESDPFRGIADRLNTLAEAADLIAPARRIATAEADMVYARYRRGMGVEIVPAADLARRDIRIGLDGPGSFWFRRRTLFVIVAAVDGIRLRHFADGAVENWHGTGFAALEAARSHAVATFGIARRAWTAA